MPLSYRVQVPLTIPDEVFNTDDIATVLVTGARYGSHWILNAIPFIEGMAQEPIGKIETVPDERPDMAIDTAYIWVNDACVKTGVRIAHFVNKNDAYGPDEAPYFASALFLIDRREERS